MVIGEQSELHGSQTTTVTKRLSGRSVLEVNYQAIGTVADRYSIAIKNHHEVVYK